MTQDQELLRLAKLVEEETEEKPGETGPSNTAIMHKPMNFGDTQLIGYRPRTRPGANTKFWKIARGLLYACVLLFLGTLLWSYFDSGSPSAPAETQPQAAAPAAAQAQPGVAAVTTTGSLPAAGDGGVTLPAPARPSAEAVPYVNRLRPAGVLESLASGGKQPELLSLDRVRLPIDGKPLQATVVLYAQLDERTERRWQEAKVLAKSVSSPNPFLKPVTIADANGLDLLRDWHVEGVVVSK